MRLLNALRKKTRSKRREVFMDHIALLKAKRGDNRILKIVDIGGTVAFWEKWWNVRPQDGLHITLINNHESDTTLKDEVSGKSFIRNLGRDAMTLTSAELSAYDVVFSNSFFEHLKSREQQKALAAVITASGLPYFIQVPNKHSPVDPHHPFAPFFALYPFALRARLLTLSAFGPSRKAKSLQAARRWQEHYHPLSLADMRALFPGAQFKMERPFGVPMSILAARGAAPATAMAA